MPNVANIILFQAKHIISKKEVLNFQGNPTHPSTVSIPCKDAVQIMSSKQCIYTARKEMVTVRKEKTIMRCFHNTADQNVP